MKGISNIKKFVFDLDELDLDEPFADCLNLSFSVMPSIATEDDEEEVGTSFVIAACIPYLEEDEPVSSKSMEDYSRKEIKKIRNVCFESIDLFIDIIQQRFMQTSEDRERIFEAINEFLEIEADDDFGTEPVIGFIIEHIFKKIMTNKEDKLRLSVILKEF